MHQVNGGNPNQVHASCHLRQFVILAVLAGRPLRVSIRHGRAARTVIFLCVLVVYGGATTCSSAYWVLMGLCHHLRHLVLIHEQIFWSDYLVRLEGCRVIVRCLDESELA